MPTYDSDSPLSITASIAGILTFLAAILAALYVRLTYLRNANTEYFQVKSSLSWYKTESMFMSDLIQAPDSYSNGSNGKEREMYSFVMEELRRLEARLLDLLAEAEEGANGEGEKPVGSGTGRTRWTVVPRGLAGRGSVAMSWMGVRGKALELVRQRDALGSRVLFAQMSLTSSRVKEQEARMRKRDETQRERMESLESLVMTQSERLEQMQDSLYRVIHRGRGEDDRSPRYKESSPRPDGEYPTTARKFADTGTEQLTQSLPIVST